MDKTYESLCAELDALLRGVPHAVSNLANASALIFSHVERLNWAGFYLAEDGRLVLGPFQGKPACIEIPFGKGVCGTAAAEKRTVVVPDVRLFAGHIACDSASLSEIVIPLTRDGELFGVLDLDSAETGRFSAADAEGLEKAAGIITGHCF